MIRIFLPLVCAALGCAAASCSQSETPLAPAAEAPASPQPTSHGAASAAMASPSDPQQANGTGESASATDQTAAGASQAAEAPSNQPPSNPPDAPTSTSTERRASTLIGMVVVAANGSSLGEVKDIIFDRQGRATHLVIAYVVEAGANPGTQPNDVEGAPTADDKLTAMPWDAAMASIKDGELVVDSAQLQGAPSFTTDSWPNLDDPAWSATADAYWRKAVRAAIAANPGAPIDSTSRQRARPNRDGE